MVSVVGRETVDRGVLVLLKFQVNSQKQNLEFE